MAWDLLVAERNQVFETVRESGFNPADFEWRTVPSQSHGQTVPQLRYRPRGARYYLTFDQAVGGDTYFLLFSPSLDTIEGYEHAKDSGELLGHVKFWLGYLQREVAQVDLWEALGQVPALAQVQPTDEDDAPLSGEERTLFLAAVAQVKRAAAAEVGDRKQFEAIRAALERIESQSDRIARKDVWTMFLGNVMALVMAGVLTVQSAQWVFGKLSGAVSWLVLASYSGLHSLPR